MTHDRKVTKAREKAEFEERMRTRLADIIKASLHGVSEGKISTSHTFTSAEIEAIGPTLRAMNRAGQIAVERDGGRVGNPTSRRWVWVP